MPRGLAVVNRFLPPLPRDPLTLLAERTVIRKREKRTSTRRSLGALSRLEICGRAHDVRSSGSRQNTRVRDSVSKTGHGTVLEFSTERVDGDGVKVSKTADKEGSLMTELRPPSANVQYWSLFLRRCYGGRLILFVGLYSLHYFEVNKHWDFESRNVLRNKRPCSLKITDFGFQTVNHKVRWRECD